MDDHTEIRPAMPLDHCVIVLAPLGRDAAVVSETFGQSSVATKIVRTFAELVDHVHRGVGAVVVTQEALTSGGVAELIEALETQPSWSDLPVLLLLAAEDGLAFEVTRQSAPLRAARNVTVLKRPTPAVTLVTAIHSALRARRRQYEVRDLIVRERVAREEAEAATRVKDAFLATVSHELRTPLSAILIWSHMLEEEGRLTHVQTRDAIHAITTSAEAQSRLIEDLLDVSRMLTGKLRIDLQRCALAPIVEAAIEVVRPMAEAKGVDLEARLDARVVVLVDAERGQQIFWNLLSNAVKFTPAGGRVSIRLIPDASQAQVVVQDTGEGIAPEFLPHVFERFRQGDPGSTRRHGGLGLGLTIVQQLVELLGGTVRAESAGAGKGATFTVHLPIPSE